MRSWASSWTADMPLEWVAMRCAAQNHTVSGNLDRCIAVPAVIDVWRPQSRLVGVRPALQQCCASVATGGADKPLWPTPLKQERCATRLVRKARLKLVQRSRPSHPMSPPARRCSPAHGSLILHIDLPGTAG